VTGTADVNERSTSHAPSPEAELRVRRLETASRYLFANLLPLPLVVVGFAVLLGQWHEAAALWIWAAVTTLAWAATLTTLRAFLNDPRRTERVTRWTIAICVAIFVSSLAFASVSPLFWADGERLNNVLLYVVLAAGLASAGAQSAPCAPLCVANLTPYGALFLYISLANEAYPIGPGIAFLQLCYIVLVALHSRTVWQLADEMLRLKIEKRQLIDQLQTALVDATAAQARAEAASSAKSEFLANMSHELRTPLNAILGFSEIIRDRIFGDAEAQRYSEYGGHIHFSGSHLLGLIGDILDLSKIEAGKRELDEAEIDVVHLSREALHFVEPQAAHKGLTLALNAPHHAVVRADERALRQIVANLLSNAVKFTPEGGQVELSVASGSAGVTLTVADTGVGIRPEDMAKVLECFGQARHDITTTDERGTGLGLPIVKGLVELHGGKLTIASTPGSGTTVTVSLPLERSIRPRLLVSAA
jgi:two-component system cell cycle sensor histidine kinase PleC